MREGLGRRGAVVLICGAVVLGWAAAAAAQSIGIRGGVNVATEHTTVPPGQGILVAETRADLRPVFGGFIGTDDRVPVGAHIEVLYDQVGIAVKHPQIPIWYTYVTIPVLAKVRLVRDTFHRLHLLAGPSFSALVDAKRDLGNGAEDVPGVDKVSIGLSTGLMFSMGRFVIDGRYIHGLTNLIENAAPGFKTTRRVLSVSVGFQFGE